jgi:2-methylcitrate dehydratase PrpD
MSTVACELAGFAVSWRAEPLPPTVRHAAVRAVTDWVSAVVPGSVLPAARVIREVADVSDSGVSRLVPSGRPVGVRTAALVNGTAAHAAELDDIYRDALYHPGAPTVAAALALAEHADASGEELLRAVTFGYEIGARVALAVAPAHYRNWHPTGTAGTIGAAAAAAELLRLETTEFAHALTIATTMAAGLQQTIRTGPMAKPLHSGHAAEAGVLAALAASKGLTGALDILEGGAGFGVATAGIANLSVSGLGDPFCVTEATVKYHACCGHAFAAIDAALELRASGVRARDVARVEIGTYRTATEVAGHPDPYEPEQARFSLAYTVAAALVLGSVRLRAFTPEALAHPDIRRLTGCATVRVDPELDAMAPRRRAARVRLTDRAGGRHEAVRLTRKGDPDDPVSDSELRAKFDELVVPVLGERRAASIVGSLWDLPDLGRVRDLDWG